MIKDRKEKQERRKRLFRLILLMVIVSIAGSFLLFSKKKTTLPPVTKTSAVIVSAQSVTTAPSPTPILQNSAGLETAVQSALVGTHGSYGIVVKNLKTQESYYLNATQQYNSASLYKLWVMATVFQAIQDKKMHLTDKISKDVIALNHEFNLEPDPNEQTSGILTLTIQDALYQTITISSNNAALLLTDKISVPALESFLQKNNFSQSSIGIEGKPPTTTAYDVALFFEKLYHGDLANKENTDNMLTLLKQQKLNDKLPKYLPQDVAAAHKTGELDDFTHDTGIVYTPNDDYIIVVLSQTDNPDLAKERISLVSQAAYIYFTQTSSSQ